MFWSPGPGNSQSSASAESQSSRVAPEPAKIPGEGLETSHACGEAWQRFCGHPLSSQSLFALLCPAKFIRMRAS